MKKVYLNSICIIVIFITVSSCSWLDREIQVPSYIYIPSYSFQALPTQGTSSSNISDAWVFVNGQKIGAFELPATIPVLASGNCVIDIYPGIKLNGTSSTRAVYTFYTRYTTETILYPDSTVTIAPSAVYEDGLTFDFIEDFESVGIIFDKTDRSDTTLMKIDDPEHVFEGSYCGYVALESGNDFFEAKTLNTYNLPKTGAFCFVELNCKSTVPFYIGLFSNEFNYSTQHPIVVITPSETWKKLYINLTPTLSRLQSALNFNIFIAAQLEENTTNGKIWIDNIKLIHY